MPKKYSQEFLLNLNTLDGDRIGVQLAKACVNADLPITEVAKIFKVSRMTMHSWLNDVWTEQFENQTEELPLADQKLAKAFLENNIIPKLN